MEVDKAAGYPGNLQKLSPNTLVREHERLECVDAKYIVLRGRPVDLHNTRSIPGGGGSISWFWGWLGPGKPNHNLSTGSVRQLPNSDPISHLITLAIGDTYCCTLPLLRLIQRLQFRNMRP